MAEERDAFQKRRTKHKSELISSKINLINSKRFMMTKRKTFRPARHSLHKPAAYKKSKTKDGNQ